MLTLLKKKYQIYSFLTLILTASTAAQAQIQNTCKLSPKSLIQNDLFISGQKPDCQFVADIDSLILDISMITQTRININLFIQSKSDNASFDGGTILNLPQKLVFTTQYGQEFEAYSIANYAVISHEYGHAVFDQRLEATFKKDSFSIYKKISTLKIKLLTDLTLTSIQKVEIDKQLKTLNDQIVESTSELTFINTALPYSELFADVIAVFNFNDKEAILNSLYYDEMSTQAFDMIRLRSFGPLPAVVNASYLSDAHLTLAETRAWIGQNLWPKSLAEKIRFTEIVLKASVKSINQELTATSVKSAAQKNAQLISNIQELLK